MNNNDAFEEQLAEAMRRVEAPRSLAVYLMNAAEAEAHRATSTRVTPRFAFPKMQSWFGGALAAVLLVGSFGAVQEHRHHERLVEASQQFEASQRITDRTLDRVREQLQSKGISLDPQ